MSKVVAIMSMSLDGYVAECFLEIEESRFESEGARPVWKALPGRSAPRDSAEAFEAIQAHLEKAHTG